MVFLVYVYVKVIKDLEERQVLQALKLAGIKITGLNPQQEDLQ